MNDLPLTRSFVIGTAGHIDHGKSTLVQALTGIDPDRLAEEKARGMTIDLGFAWLQTPAGNSVGVVDVPGHERFIKTMLAGVGGIDAALLVIAADEGPMPQTIEHLAILDLLQVRTGVIALTKSDLVDRDWLDLVTEEIRERVHGTALERAQIVPVSATTGSGLSFLLAGLDRALAQVARTASHTKPRLPIDRVFTVAGFGTVVTGTLIGGELTAGQELEVMPSGIPTRIRGMQTHAKKVDRAIAGSRLAVNLSGLAVADLRRGDVLAVPGLLTPAQRVDVRLQLLADSPIALAQNDEIDFFAGSAETSGWLTLLDREQLIPGDMGWVQVRFHEPIAVLKGDRFIVRRPSPSQTIGGGEIVDPNPIRHRRFRPEVLSSLETLSAGAPDELILHELSSGPLELKTLRQQLSPALDQREIDGALIQLIAEGDIVPLEMHAGEFRSSDFVVATTVWNATAQQIEQTLNGFHQTNRLRKGMPREELRSRLRLDGPQRLFDAMIKAAAARGIVIEEGSTIRRADFSIKLDSAQDEKAVRYAAALKVAPFTPPAPAEFGIESDLLGAIIDLGRVVKVADDVIYDPDAYREIERGVLALLDRDGSVTLAGFRDHFRTSRKYAQATLEYLDQQRITRRVGDVRVRHSGPGAGTPVGGAL